MGKPKEIEAKVFEHFREAVDDYRECVKTEEVSLIGVWTIRQVIYYVVAHTEHQAKQAVLEYLMRGTTPYVYSEREIIDKLAEELETATVGAIA